MDPSELAAFLATNPPHTEAGARAAKAEHACRAALFSEEYDQATACVDLSRGLWDYVESHPAATVDQKAYAKFGWTRATMMLASLQRRQEEFEEAEASFAAIDERLQGMEELLRTPEPKPKGMLSRFKRQKPSGERAMMFQEWFQVSGGLRMNQGVLYNVMGRKEDAMEFWRMAEELLFDNLVKSLGPEADLEITGSVMKLWDNMLSVSIEMGDYEGAGEVLWKAVRLFSYFPMHDMENPPELEEGIGYILSTVHELQPAQRQQLNAAIDPDLVELIDDWLA